MNNENLLSRSLGVCEPVPRSFRLYFSNWRVCVPIGLMSSIPLLLFGWIAHVIYKNMQEIAADTTAATKREELVDGIPKAVMIMAWALLPIWIFVIMVGNGATIRATGEVYADKIPRLKPCLIAGLKRTCALFCLGVIILIATIIITLFFGILAALFNTIKIVWIRVILMIIWLIVFLWLLFYIFITFLVAPASVVLEKNGSTSSIRRAWTLIKGKRCYVFCVMIIMGIIGLGVSIIASFFNTTGFLVVNTLWSILAVPLGQILGTVVFLTLRVEKESLDRATLQRELGYDSEAETELAEGGGGTGRTPNWANTTTSDDDKEEGEGGDIV